MYKSFCGTSRQRYYDWRGIRVAELAKSFGRLNVTELAKSFGRPSHSPKAYAASATKLSQVHALQRCYSVPVHFAQA